MVRFDPSTLHDVTMRGMFRKLLSILAVGFIVIALMPSSVICQNSGTQGETADQVRLTDLERRAERLDTLPERTAVIEDSVHNIKEQVDALSTRAWLILAAAGAALFDRLLGVFGVKIRDRDGPG